MNALSLTLRVFAILGALAAAYFWHDTGKEKAEQVVTIGKLNKELADTKGDLDSTKNKLAGAESKAEQNQKLFDGEKSQHITTKEQLADARRDIDSGKEKLAGTETKLADSEQKNRTLSDEVESFRVQLEKSVSPEKHKALERQLADSKLEAKALVDRIEVLTKAQLALSNPEEILAQAKVVTKAAAVPKNFNKVILAKVKQVNDDSQVLFDLGTSKGALLNTDVRLQDGLTYLGFGRVIFTDATRTLVQLNEGHEKITSGKEIFLLIPEVIASVTPVPAPVTPAAN